MIRRASQPRAPKSSRSQPPQEFVIQEMPDPWGHLTEEQKQWPLCDLDMPRTPGESPINSATPTPATPKPTEG